MPTTNEDSFFFIPVKEVCHRSVVTCAPDLDLIEMARLMMVNNISGIVAVTDEKPVGIVSLRDLRNLIAEAAETIVSLKVCDVMNTSLITIHSSDYLFKAIFLMAKHNIHRLIVIDEFDMLIGVITNADLMRIQATSPLYLIQEIESAGSIEQLRNLGQNMTSMMSYALKTNADTPSLIQLIAHFNDALVQRLIYILDRYHDVRLPAGAAYLSLGSEGRQEQTLRTDQDSAIVYRDDLPPEDVEKVRCFAESIVSGLERVDVPLCPGNMMASNPEWFHSLSEWKHMVQLWITCPDPDATVHFGVFQDLRVLHGDICFESELREFICDCARNNSIFFPSMARNIVRFKPPLSMFGRFQVQKKGDQRGKLDLKKGGLFALTRGVSLIALEAGIMGGTTWSKLERLNHLHVVSDHDTETIQNAFTFLLQMRLSRQMIALSSGMPVDNYVDPTLLTDRERDQLREAFRGVNLLLDIVKHRYHLDLLAR
ncbi:MAG: putative nucleotidyltransferase substrate binding domain-containing protein [Desulfuromonadaceae bacterium]|nr:putative nucleotidyltransferase substrate binding domain-containing protein [Desulfuromonadaceae bacterium]